MPWPFARHSKVLADFDNALNRERLIQLSRIVFIDDEEQALMSELKSTGYSVDHDRSGDDLTKIDQQLYDLAILDFFGVGQRLGPMQGLDVLKHIQRVSPRTRVIAYTARSLSTLEADFFRNSSAVLQKDAGLEDSLALVEAELQKAFQKEHLFEALLQKLNVTDAATRERAKKALLSALKTNNEAAFKKFLHKTLNTVAEKSINYILNRLFAHE